MNKINKSQLLAIKSNPDATVIRVLAGLNGKFDCASKVILCIIFVYDYYIKNLIVQQEIRKVMAAGVTGDRIVFAQPAKFPSHICFAKKVGVKTMMVDNSIEILKIKEIFPDAK